MEISTNMPGIGSVILEIDMESWERFLKNLFYTIKPIAAWKMLILCQI